MLVLYGEDLLAQHLYHKPEGRHVLCNSIFITDKCTWSFTIEFHVLVDSTRDLYLGGLLFESQ
jgi:hypothetical protein